MDTIFYTTWLSLFDSLSTTYQIIVFVLLLTTAKPLRNAISYLVGGFGAYFLCGLGIYLALDQLRDLLSKFLDSASAVPSPVYYRWEFLLGLASVVLGFWYFYWKKKQAPSTREHWILSRLKNMNMWFAFATGLLISAVSISPQYVLALIKYSSLHLDFPSAFGFILFYNFVYLLPMLLILGFYLAARRGTEDDHDQLHKKARMLNLQLTTWTMVGFGLFCMVDAGCYFVMGHALLKERFL